MIRYLVVFEKTVTGYSAFAPDLPGCIATGSSKKETEENVIAAIQFHLEGLREEGLSIPESTSESEVLAFE